MDNSPRLKDKTKVNFFQNIISKGVSDSVENVTTKKLMKKLNTKTSLELTEEHLYKSTEFNK